MDESSIRLTQFSHGSGCGCKIAPEVLQRILEGSGSSRKFPLLLVGNEHADDAAVWKWSEEEYLISTTDFFTPIVDDPFLFGQIAAANALSDVFSMGGTPVMALAILGWPVDKLSASLASKVLEGGRSVCEKAGIPLAGGHSIDSPEPFFGLAVNGKVNQKQLITNAGAQPGDLLFLSKPLGTGIYSTALKRGAISEKEMQDALDQMLQLNSFGAVASTLPGLHAMTDITGFGLAGHALELCRASGNAIELYDSLLPLLPRAKELASRYFIPDNTYRNFNSYGKEISDLQADQLMILCDPQTNGGLLLSIDPVQEEAIKKLASQENIQLHQIGKVIAQTDDTQLRLFLKPDRT